MVVDNHFECRTNCGACCIAPSITSHIPGMPDGKPANIACIHLDEQLRCGLFGQLSRPAVCGNLKPCFEMCGTHQQDALNYLNNLENLTQP